MNEEKKRMLSVKITESDFEKLSEIVARYKEENNARISKSEMVAKLIRDAAERK